MTIYEAGEHIGINVYETLKNFAYNEALYEKCLKMYLQNPLFSDMEKGINENNYELVKFSAHSLKGLSGNMGFKELYEICSVIVNNIKTTDYDGIETLFLHAKRIHQKIINVIEKI